MVEIKGRHLLRAVLVVCHLLVLFLVLQRQAHPFRVVSDDAYHYNNAMRVVRDTKAVMEREGLWSATKEFVDESSVTNPRLPQKLHRKRPLVVWAWSLPLLFGGDVALTWTWRVLYVLMTMSLFALLIRLSNWPAAFFLSVVAAVAPVTQGLLAWMSCESYLTSYLFLFSGTVLLIGTTGVTRTVGGILLLVLALLSREIAFLVVPCSVGLYMLVWRRRRLAALLPVLAVAVWLVLPAENRSAFTTLRGDPELFVRSAALVAAGQSASMVRNLGLLLVLPMLAAVWPFRWKFIIPVLALALLSNCFQLLVPVVLLVVAVKTTRRALPGAAWVVVTVAGIVSYGYFTSRYAFEPLVGLCLALGPALHRLPKRKALVFVPFLLWHTAASLAPDVIYSSRAVRWTANVLDQRLRTLDLVTSLRHKEWLTVAGRAEQDWSPDPDLRLIMSDSTSAVGKVWRSGPFWRAGSLPNLHSVRTDHFVFTERTLLEWNVWYWRVVAPGKGRGIHVDLDSEKWAVHAGSPLRDHSRCLSVVESRLALGSQQRNHAVTDWLLDVPELNNPTRARMWLGEVWNSGEKRRTVLVNSSFEELELGRLFLRDDGWLDRAELSYLRAHRHRHSDEEIGGIAEKE
jgi:hypothetical protein